MTSRSTRHFTIRAVLTIRAAAGHAAAIRAVDELLSRQRIEHLFLGNVARAAWLGGLVDFGSIDALGLMHAEQKNNVAMMASNRGFRVDREEIERTAELDLVPLTFDGVRVHVLVASNALYARMFAGASSAQIGDLEIRVPSAEDLALLMTISEDDDAVRQLAAKPEFDRARFNATLTSVGLARYIA